MAVKLELSELLMAKLCHDLAGPVGAINNGVELLRDPSPILHSESVDLIEISAKEAVARLLYFRQAYGISRNSSGVSIGTIKDLVNNFFINKNLTFAWPKAHGDSDTMSLIHNDAARLILNIILIIAGSLLHGGVITTKIKHLKNEVKIKIHGQGKSIKIQDYIEKSLLNEDKDYAIDSKNVQAYLTAMLAKKICGKIVTELGKTDNGEDYIEISVD